MILVGNEPATNTTIFRSLNSIRHQTKKCMNERKENRLPTSFDIDTKIEKNRKSKNEIHYRFITKLADAGQSKVLMKRVLIEGNRYSGVLIDWAPDVGHRLRVKGHG